MEWLGLEKGNVSRPFLWWKEPASGFDVNTFTPGEISYPGGAADGWSLSLRIYELPWRDERRGKRPDEREMRRKAADRKPGVPVPRSQPIGRLPEGGDEFEVEPV